MKIQTATTESGEEIMFVEPNEEVSELFSSLMSGLGRDDKLERAEIPSEALKILDRYVAEIFGDNSCKINYCNGCNSCCADGISGSYCSTTCGPICSKVCGSQPCY